MIKHYIQTQGSIYCPSINEGETIETKISRIITNKEPIKDGAPLIYEDNKTGVAPQHNIRTDRFDLAIDAMDKVTKGKIAKRDFVPIKKEEQKAPVSGTNGTEPPTAA